MSAPALHWPLEALQQAMAAPLPGLVAEAVREIDSTNAALMRRMRAGLDHPVLLVAERQSAGRGRMGRPWQGEPGQMLSFSLGVQLQPQDWSGLSLAVGLAVAQTLHPDIGLKWPNDLWWHDRKLCGILIETANPPPGQAGRSVVIGVGLNVTAPTHAPEGGFATPAVGLRDIAPQWDAPAALLALAAPLAHALRAFEREGFAPLVQRFAARDVLAGRAVRLSDGMQGVAHGVAGDGALLIKTEAGVQAVHSAEVSVRPLASTHAGESR